MDKIITENAFTLKGRIRAIMRNAKSGKIVYCSGWQNNIIPLVGLAAIVRRMGDIGSKVNEGMITYGAVGKGTTTPANTDAAMENEIARKLIATSSVTSQTLTLEAYFAEGEANDDITKFALFGEDASAAADSGTMFEYADFATPFTKTANEVLTVEISIVAS